MNCSLKDVFELKDNLVLFLTAICKLVNENRLATSKIEKKGLMLTNDLSSTRSFKRVARCVRSGNFLLNCNLTVKFIMDFSHT